VLILKELKILLTRLNYSDIKQKHKILNKYFQATKFTVRGQKIAVPVSRLIQDLKEKRDWITAHIQKTVWLKEGFFNGYYNNDQNRVEGKSKGQIRMTLTGQTFPIMSGVATPEQIKLIVKNAKKYLRDSRLGGWRLNTDFKEEQLNLGRAFSFIYGDKENGACFNHMSVMFAYALYKRGFVKEGYEVINSIYSMALDTAKSKIYPCLPEYFNARGRGMYSYLTGSASWFILNLLTQVFGVRGEYGDLVLEPKLTKQQFQASDHISISCWFAQKRVNFEFINLNKKNYGKYKITSVHLNGKIIAKDIYAERFIMPRQKFLALSERLSNSIEVNLD
jgi:cellobiose phosphorylase